MQYFVQIEASNEDGTIWQALSPTEAVEGESAEEVAAFVAHNQNVAEDNYRIVVREDADSDPVFVLNR